MEDQVICTDINKLNLQNIDYNKLYKKVEEYYSKLNIDDEEDNIILMGIGGPNLNTRPLFGEVFSFMSKKKLNIDVLSLVSNNDDLDIKAKCWKLPESLVEEKLERYIRNKSNKVERYRRVLSLSWYLKYIKIKYKSSEIIIDMDDLDIKKFTNKDDLNNFNLPENEETEFENISITKKRSSDIGLCLGNTITQPLRVTNRIITLYTSDGKINIRLARDRKNVINRNSIDISGDDMNWSRYTGVLISRDDFELESDIQF